MGIKMDKTSILTYQQNIILQDIESFDRFSKQSHRDITAMLEIWLGLQIALEDDPDLPKELKPSSITKQFKKYRGRLKIWAIRAYLRKIHRYYDLISRKNLAR